MTTGMNEQIDNYLPHWIDELIRRSVDKAIDKRCYQSEFARWEKTFPPGLLWFQYYYYKEVIVDYMDTHGDWGFDQLKQGRIFREKEVTQ